MVTACSGQSTTKISALLTGALFEPSWATTVAIFSRIPSGPRLHMSRTLSGFSVQATVIALSAVTPFVQGYGGHGESAAFSPTQNVYLLGCPCVLASPAPGRAPPTCMSRKRTARPTVALARHHG